MNHPNGSDRQNRAWLSNPVIEWLITEGWRIRSTGQLVNEICDRLVASGVPLTRFSSYVTTLHPEVYGDAYTWRLGQKPVYNQASHDMLDLPMMTQSPVVAVIKQGSAIRRRLTDANTELGYSVLEEFRAEGMTNYLAQPMRFSDGSTHCVSFATNHAAGFSADHIALFEYITHLMGRLGEVHAVRRVAERLLDTYVGRDAGHRILAGQVMRGSGDTIRAAIWFCDLRGFTTLSEQLPREALIGLLNAYFDRMAGPVQEQGGEILKFIGDAMLAIFPVSEKLTSQQACTAALQAAGAALGGMEDLNREQKEGQPQLGFGLGLHVGDVMYGNVGARNRLDFTVIGPSVNLVSRLEGLCKPLGQRLLASADFASHCPGPFVSLGTHEMKGIENPQEVFGLTLARLGAGLEAALLDH